MPIDVYAVPAEQKTYTRQNLFVADSHEIPNHSIGVNIYQDFAYTQFNSQSYLAMTTGATVVADQWVEFGVFCSYTLPSIKPINVQISTGLTTTDLKTNFYCGNTLGFIAWPESMVHAKFAVDLGIGSEKTKKCQYVDDENGTRKSDDNCVPPTSPFNQVYARQDFTYPVLVIRPAILLEANLFSFLQWTFGVRYRFQFSPIRTAEASKIGSKSSWLEISTGPVFNIR